MLFRYNSMVYFLDTGDELVRSARRLHTQRHIIRMRSLFFCAFLSMGGKVENYLVYGYFGIYVTLTLVPSGTVVKLPT